MQTLNWIRRGCIVLLLLQVMAISQTTLPDKMIFPDGIGLATHYPFTSDSSTAQRWSTLGLGNVRVELSWEDIETAPGVFELDTINKRIRRLHEAGLKPLIILNYHNDVYACTSAGRQCGVSSESARNAFGRYCDTIFKHIKSNWPSWDVMYEVWNEPDGSTWKDIVTDTPWNVDSAGAQYTALVHEVWNKLNAINWGAFKRPALLVGSLSDIGVNGQTFFEKCLNNGIVNYADGVSIHPYRFRDIDTVSYNFPETVTEERGTDAGTFQQIRRMMSSSTSSGGKVLPLVISEWNYSAFRTGTDFGSYDKPKQFVSEETQAQYTARMHLISISQDIRGVYTYSWEDGDALKNTKDYRMGLLRYDGARSLSYTADSILSHVLAGNKFESRYSVGDRDCYALRFFDPATKKTNIAFWTSLSCSDYFFPSSAGKAYTSVSMLGLVSTATANGDGLNLAFGNSPTYILGLPHPPNPGIYYLLSN